MNIQTWPLEGQGEPGVIRCYVEVAIGATGAVGAVARCRGFRPTGLSRASAGLYTWLLNEGVQAIVAWNLQVLTANPTTVAQGMEIIMKTRTISGASPSIIFQCVRSDTGAAADPGNGDSIVGFVDLKVSSS